MRRSVKNIPDTALTVARVILECERWRVEERYREHGPGEPWPDNPRTFNAAKTKALVDVLADELRTNKEKAQNLIDAYRGGYFDAYVVDALDRLQRTALTHPDEDKESTFTDVEDESTDDETYREPTPPPDDRNDRELAIGYIVKRIAERTGNLTESEAERAKEVILMYDEMRAPADVIVQAAVEAVREVRGVFGSVITDDEAAAVPPTVALGYDIGDAFEDRHMRATVIAWIEDVIEREGDFYRCGMPGCSEYAFPVNDSGRFDKRVRTCRIHDRHQVANAKRSS